MITREKYILNQRSVDDIMSNLLDPETEVNELAERVNWCKRWNGMPAADQKMLKARMQTAAFMLGVRVTRIFRV